MTEMILLGAGASVEAGVPTAVQMTDKILTKLRSEMASKLPVWREIRALEFLLDSIRSHDPTGATTIDIETVLNATTALGSTRFKTADLAPFVSAWLPDIVDLLADLLGSGNAFDALTAELRAELGRLVWIQHVDASKTEYLAPLLSFVHTQDWS